MANMELGPIADWHVTEDRRVLLVDQNNHRVVVHQPDGRADIHGRKGNLPGHFHYPRCLLAIGDLAYVVDAWNHRIQVFDLASWTFRFQFGELGSGAGQFFCPSWIVFFDPCLIVADTNNARLSFHAANGTFLFEFALADSRFPRKVRTAGGYIEVEYEDGKCDRVDQFF